jgi:hypothetical protein
MEPKQFELPVDFAIITVIPEERDAVIELFGLNDSSLGAALFITGKSSRRLTTRNIRFFSRDAGQEVTTPPTLWQAN